MIDFEQGVEKAMGEVVRTHRKFHFLYQPTEIRGSIVDKDNKRAVFVLFEQIDTDK